MKKISWEYYFARKFSLQRYQIVMRVFVSPFFWKHFGVRLKDQLVKPNGDGNYAIYLEKTELQKMQEKIFRVVCGNLKKFYSYKRMIKRVQKNWLAVAKKTAAEVNQKISDVKLLALYNVFLHHYQEHFNKPIWIIFPIEPLLAEAADDAVRSILTRAKKLPEYDHWLKVVFSPEEVNAIVMAQQATLALALKIKKGLSEESRDRALKKLVARHAFIPCYDVVDAPWGVDHFNEELSGYPSQSISELTANLSEVKGRFREAQSNFKLFLKSFQMNQREREVCIMAHELVFLKDERDDYRRHGCYYGRKLYGEIGRRLGLDTRDVASMTIEETKKAIAKGISPAFIFTLKERRRGYLLLKKNKQPFLVEGGNEIQKTLLRELGQELTETNNMIKGQIGSTGKVSGKAVIVHTKHDLRHIFEGAVMIAVTTSPDFVPAMSKSSAIVTDEGGLTCHAAIVSREMHKPCIVGTKNATKVFRDGDMVEVDAEKGIVRKIY